MGGDESGGRGNSSSEAPSEITVVRCKSKAVAAGAWVSRREQVMRLEKGRSQ